MSSNDPSKDLTRIPTAEAREAAVSTLTAAFANDAIAVDEFERRVAAVYDAKDYGALKKLIGDLPAPANEASNVPARVDHSTDLARRPQQQLSSVLSSVKRKVRGAMPERLDVRSIAGAIEVDLRRADFPPGVTEIHVDAIMGNIEIELPDDVLIEDESQAILGNFEVNGRSSVRRGESAPIVRITGRALLGNVEIEID